MFFNEKTNRMLKAGGAGTLAGIGIKMLLDSGARSKSSAGFFNALNGVTFNLFARVSEKTGTSENSTFTIVMAIAVAGGLYYFLRESDKKQSYLPNPNTSINQNFSGQGNNNNNAYQFKTGDGAHITLGSTLSPK